MSTYPDDDPPHTPTSLYITLALIMVGLTLAVVMVVVAVARTERSPSVTLAKTGHKDPYDPDCAIVRTYLRQQYGSAVEVVAWGSRTIINDDVIGGHALLDVRFRVANGRTKHGLFTIGPGDIVESAAVTD